VTKSSDYQLVDSEIPYSGEQGIKSGLQGINAALSAGLGNRFGSDEALEINVCGTAFTDGEHREGSRSASPVRTISRELWYEVQANTNFHPDDWGRCPAGPSIEVPSIMVILKP
jgi:hypothetical protein